MVGLAVHLLLPQIADLKQAWQTMQQKPAWLVALADRVGEPILLDIRLVYDAWFEVELRTWRLPAKSLTR